MSLFAVSSDSTCDLKKDVVMKRNIWFTPLTFTMEKDGEMQEYLDDFSREEEYIEFYNKVRVGYFPRTAKLNYQAHIEHFTKMAKAGVKECVHFTISSGLANTITITEQAAKDIKEKYPDFNVYAVDPLSATVGQGLLVEIACDCRDKNMTAKETFDYVLSLRQRLQHCIIPNDLFYLKKGGRVSTASAVLGTVLNVKPMLTFDALGKLQVVDKCKGTKKAFSKVIECVQRAPLTKEERIVIVHTDNKTGAEELASLLKKETGITPQITLMGPVIGSHVGPGSVSCAWISDKTREELFS